jgi:hypothetical protein
VVGNRGGLWGLSANGLSVFRCGAGGVESDTARGATVTDRPGCLACVGGNCVVHAHDGGKPCEHCQGTGSTFYYEPTEWYVNHRKVFVKGNCLICAGTGLRDAKRGAAREKSTPMSQRPLMQLMTDEHEQ